MGKSNSIIRIFLIGMFTVIYFTVNGQTKDTLRFYDAQMFPIIGKYHNEASYNRFPDKHKISIREDVWSLSTNSAGMSVRFRTNATQITIRWTAKYDNNLDHMASTGVKGVDLYAYVDDGWKYAGTGRVKGLENEFTIMTNREAIYREYLLNLPLYDGVESLSIGVNENAIITPPSEGYLTDQKPVVYYGTSIAQGGCASRPGMAFTNILARAMDRPIINMGFSGNGTMDIPVGEAIAEIDAALYVIDCNANMKTDDIYEKCIALVKLLKGKRPQSPVLLVEQFYFVSGFGKPEESYVAKGNIELKKAYETLKKSGIKQLYYKKGEGLIGDDYEGTVDGVHPNDVGMLRMAESLEPAIRKIVE